MRPAHLPTPVTDAEIHHLQTALTNYPSGLTRADLERLFGSDRRGRLVIATAVENGELAIIHDPETNTYRKARNIDEVTREIDSLASRERRLERRRRGLMEAWQAGGTSRRQPSLYEPGNDPG